jgi:hypothetical protein
LKATLPTLRRPARNEPTPAPERLGKYDIIREVGRG